MTTSEPEPRVAPAGAAWAAALRRPTPVTGAIALVVALAFPLAVSNAYYINILLVCGVYIVFALSYDVAVGRIGALSLAHPAFFGMGAYAAAILSTRAGTSFLEELPIAALAAGLTALIVGIPAFRLSEHSFGIATLGFALILQMVALNQVNLTRGPLCISQVPSLGIGSLTRLGLPELTQQYYMILLGVLVTVGLVVALARSRVGRTFAAVRDDEILAAAQGIRPLKYKLIAFSLGAAVAGALGSFYAHYLTIVCPTNFNLSYTVSLLIIVFLGGRGSIRGIVVAAVVFTALPEFLQISTDWRLIIYGAILLVSITYMPDGFEGILRLARARTKR
jgi:ABC-type branched-subunit amino acid transport system permease subunit